MHPFCVPWWWRLSTERVESAGGSGLGRPDRNTGDLDLGQRLTVTLPLVVAGLVLELVDDDLRALGVRDDLAGHGDLGQSIGLRGDGGPVHHQDRGQGHRSAGLALELLDLDDVAL